MDSAKYRNLFQYLKKKVYPESFTKQDKTTLRKSAKKFEYDSKLESLFYVAKEKDGTVSAFHPVGALGYFLGGYVPPGTPNWHPVLKKNSPKIDTPF